MLDTVSLLSSCFLLSLMSDSSAASAGLTIPTETQAKFATIIALILGSESMNQEERQYWINILPIMTPEQLKNLSEILINEKEQLAAIDKKYAEKIKESAPKTLVKDIEKNIRSNTEKRHEVESKVESEEAEEESSILEQIRNL